MHSLHSVKSQRKAGRLGAFAGALDTTHLWSLSKRELLEVALRFGALNAGESDNITAGIKAVDTEIAALRQARII